MLIPLCGETNMICYFTHFKVELKFWISRSLEFLYFDLMFSNHVLSCSDFSKRLFQIQDGRSRIANMQLDVI